MLTCKDCRCLNSADYCAFIDLELRDYDYAVDCDGYTPKSKQKDAINPSHYKQGKVECIDAIESATVNKKGIEAVCVANIVKYLWRYEEKNGLEDVQKCKWYLNRLIETLESKNNVE